MRQPLPALMALLSASMTVFSLAVPSPTWGQDLDGDGWSVAEGDCCDVPTVDCPSPELVNPGAYDVPANGYDDDCDGFVDNPTPLDCSTGNDFAPSAPDLAMAMGLCQLAASNPPPVDLRWGLINAQLLRPNGFPADSTDLQVAVRTDFGPSFTPRAEGTLAVLSTGTARVPGDPGYTVPYPGTSHDVQSSPPFSWLQANGGQLYTATACPQANPSSVLDPIVLRLTIRVPTNADSLSFDAAFLTAEYPDTCSLYNDHFLALLDSGAGGIPADGNILLSSDPFGLVSPLSVQTAPFDICDGCAAGNGALSGTGFDPTDGAVDWIHVTAPVVPGETVTLDLVIWDTTDPFADCTALIDAFAWSFLAWAPAGTSAPASASMMATTLESPRPSPFRDGTTIPFTLRMAGRIRLTVHDVGGKLVTTLADRDLAAGPHTLSWNGRNASGQAVPPGVYFVRLDATGEGRVRKVTRIR